MKINNLIALRSTNQITEICSMSQELKADNEMWSVKEEHNTRNIFLEKSYTKCGEETSSKPLFSKKSKLSIAYLWINNLKFYTVCFHFIPSWGLSKYIETTLQAANIKLFFKKKQEVWK